MPDAPPKSGSRPHLGQLSREHALRGVAWVAEFLNVSEYKHVLRWADAITKRPAVERGRMVNRVRGEPSSQLPERHDASDFLTKTQDKLNAAASGKGG